MEHRIGFFFELIDITKKTDHETRKIRSLTRPFDGNCIAEIVTRSEPETLRLREEEEEAGGPP